MEMRMTDSLRQQAYAQAAAFVHTLDRRDRLALQRDWSLSPGVADEIIEMLDSYFAVHQALSLAPLADGKPGEATLHLEMSGDDGALRLHYQYIGS